MLPGNPRCYTAKSGTSTKDSQDNQGRGGQLQRRFPESGDRVSLMVASLGGEKRQHLAKWTPRAPFNSPGLGRNVPSAPIGLCPVSSQLGRLHSTTAGWPNGKALDYDPLFLTNQELGIKRLQVRPLRRSIFLFH